MEFHDPLPPEKPRLHAFRLAYFRCLKLALWGFLLLGLAALLGSFAVTEAANTPLPMPELGRTFFLKDACDKYTCGTGYANPWLGHLYLFIRHWALWGLGLFFFSTILGLVLQNLDPDPD